MMPHAIFPRTPGRDFSGIVVAGPPDLLGQEVFGSSGDLGIRCDGTHATHLVVEADGIVRKPPMLSAEEAAGIGVPFVTAIEGFRRAGLPQPGDTVLILGLNGKVGQAAAQIAAWLGARVLGAVRRPEPYDGHAQGQVEVIDTSSTDLAARVRDLTGGKGANIVFNTVGEPYYDAGTKSLATLGRQIFIASIKEPVALDIFALYRGRQTFVGIDTLALSTVVTAELVRSLLPGFESGALKPFPIVESAMYPLSEAAAAYAAVMGSTRDRIVLIPNI
jgi:NADPH2:quinone reductase